LTRIWFIGSLGILAAARRRGPGDATKRRSGRILNWETYV
jgi:hypothetical protein